MTDLPRRFLRNDHLSVWQQLIQVEDQLLALKESGKPEYAYLGTLLLALNDTVERHFLKEEVVLTAALKNAQAPDDASMQALLREHESLRLKMLILQATLEQEIEDEAKGDEETLARLLELGNDVVGNLIEHMAHEEVSAIFLDAEQLLSVEEKRQSVERLIELEIWSDAARAGSDEPAIPRAADAPGRPPETTHREVLLEYIRGAKLQFIHDEQPSEVYRKLLEGLIVMTRSHCGFIGVMMEDGSRILKLRTGKSSASDDAITECCDEQRPKVCKTCDLETIFDAVMATKKPIITHDQNSRSVDLPEGVSRKRGFLGLPIHCQGSVVGVAVTANWKGDYRNLTEDDLQPWLSTSGCILEAYRVRRKREHTEAELRQADGALHGKEVSILPPQDDQNK